MNICSKYLSLFVVGFIVGLLLSTDAFARTEFYIVPNDSNQKINCDFLEIKNNQALCTANNLLITYDLARVIKIEAVNNGISQHFQNFTQDTINRINDLNSNKTSTKQTKEQAGSKQTRFDFIPSFAQSLIGNLKHQSGNISLSTILLISGLIVFLIGSIGFLIATFRAGILWGLGCMFLPLVSFIFLFVHWKTASKPFLVSMLGIAILFLSTMFLSTAGTTQSIAKYASDTTLDNRNIAEFQCSGKSYCSEMSSCAEAKFYLHNCRGTKIDGNNDGIPCEKQWCGN